MTPTEDELRRWREVAGKATPGEWLRRNATSVGTINGYLMFCEFPRDAEHASTFNPLTITRLIDAVETLRRENERLRRCLVPVTMHLAQLELERGLEAPDDMIVLYFMGSGASDQVTVKEIREALGSRKGDQS